MILLYAIPICALFPSQDLPVNKKEEIEIPLTEDLMKEHGLLNRVLLIYEEIIRRLDQDIDFPISALANAINIIQSFIENYHEKLEEDYVFPIFEKHKKEMRLVRTLKNQHVKGREITAQLQQLVTSDNLENNKKKIKTLLQKFITMYRPHEAREDTVLFPKVRSLISEQAFKKLSETFEDMEHKLFGEHGFETVVNKVAAIEKKLGIYKLEQFTPKIEK
jgi:hemerythrin-like domain-containing protein